MTPVAQTASTMAQALRQAMESLGGIQKRPALEQWIWSHYPDKWSPNTLVGHLNGCCVNNPAGIKNHPSFPRFLYYRGNGEYELYSEAKHGAFDKDGYPEGQPHDSDAAHELGQKTVAELAEQASAEFAYETHLRDYLAKNLGLLEPGLSLWTGSGSDSVEFAVEGRRIDILAKDKTGVPVVIELKVSRGHERTVGQALYYRGKLKKILGVAKVRILIVAGDITDELRIASEEVQDVELFTYELSMQVHRISITS
ncbi:MAG TPA: endonuclease NucS domain-containing protein [Acidobacteriaceae bacterium]|nr:endonuclease NucS domain-containing protein [Acidobacteriaceae bacterium]